MIHFLYKFGIIAFQIRPISLQLFPATTDERNITNLCKYLKTVHLEATKHEKWQQF